MIQWVGFRQTSIPVEHDKRKQGRTNYTFRKLLNLSMDVILSFSDKPLRLTIKLGISISVFSFLLAIIVILLNFSNKIEISGWTSLIISIWFLSGIIILLLGIVGLYIAKIFENTKNRPNFIISKTYNLPK